MQSLPIYLVEDPLKSPYSPPFLKGGWARPPCEPAGHSEATAEADGQGEAGGGIFP